jgi:hypothetical protein
MDRRRGIRIFHMAENVLKKETASFLTPSHSDEIKSPAQFSNKIGLYPTGTEEPVILTVAPSRVRY